MAARAVVAKLAAMAIVASVALGTLPRCIGGIAGTAVACRADQSLVLSGKRKISSPVVIETPGGPVGDIVAAATISRRAQGANMVVVHMTIRAGYSRCGKSLVGVTGRALGLCMAAEEGKSTQVMIEPHARGPILAVMALRATWSQFPLMGIVIGMAIGAFTRQAQFLRWRRVASFACDGCMGTSQWELRHRGVIEFNLIPGGFGVAARAVLAITAFMRVIGAVATDAV